MSRQTIVFCLTGLILVCALMTILMIHNSYVEAKPGLDLDMLQKWSFSEDYLKITVNDKTYDNYTVTIREGEDIKFINMGANYLTSSALQYEYSPEEFFTEGIKSEMKSLVRSLVRHYPYSEILTINNQPWRETEYEQVYLEFFERTYGHGTGRAGREKAFDIAYDPDYTGYADKILIDGYSLGEAVNQYPLDQRKVRTTYQHLFRNYTEMCEHSDLSHIEMLLDNSLYFSEHIDAIRKPLEVALQKINTNAKLKALEVNVQEQQKKEHKNSLQLTLQQSIIQASGRSSGLFSVSNLSTVPMEDLANIPGVSTVWDPIFKTLTITTDDTRIVLTADADYALVNRRQVKVDTPMTVVDDKVMVPMQFILESLK